PRGIFHPHSRRLRLSPYGVSCTVLSVSLVRVRQYGAVYTNASHEGLRQSNGDFQRLRSAPQSLWREGCGGAGLTARLEGSTATGVPEAAYLRSMASTSTIAHQHYAKASQRWPPPLHLYSALVGGVIDGCVVSSRADSQHTGWRCTPRPCPFAPPDVRAAG